MLIIIENEAKSYILQSLDQPAISIRLVERPRFT